MIKDKGSLLTVEIKKDITLKYLFFSYKVGKGLTWSLIQSANDNIDYWYRELEVEHPAAKMLILGAQMQAGLPTIYLCISSLYYNFVLFYIMNIEAVA